MLYNTASTFGGANLYSYCLNNPILYTDPDGESIILLIFGLITGSLIAKAAAVAIAVVVVAIVVALVVDNWDAITDAFKSPSKRIIGFSVSAATSIGTVPWVIKGAIDIYSFSRQSGKERSTDKPSWVDKDQIDPNLSAQDNAKKMLDNKYGTGNWRKGPNSEFNKIIKWIIRHLRNSGGCGGLKVNFFEYRHQLIFTIFSANLYVVYETTKIK